jgi:hypothetical protein
MIENLSVEDSNHNGRILTFYSYKGGTGRSMLLANVAWVLASNGKSVLAIDWDLEAPGLYRYFYPFLTDKELRSSDGLINFVEEYRIRALSPTPPGEIPAPDWFAAYADLRHYAVRLDRKFPGEGRLDFVPAGRQDESYSALVHRFNWQDFYERLGGSQFLEKAAEILQRHYDYILIDSRTGVSDTSGICTVKMPDALVVCFTLNHQSIHGAAGVADYANRLRGPSATAGEELKGPESVSSRQKAEPQSRNKQQRFNIYPVPMRLENAQSRKLERRREYAQY